MARKPAHPEETPDKDTPEVAAPEAQKSTTDLAALRVRQEQERLRARLRTKFH